VREASILDLLSTAIHGAPALAATYAGSKVMGALRGLGQDAFRAAAPNAYARVTAPLARAGEIAAAPERLLRQHAVPAALQRSPEEALLRGLAGTPGPTALDRSAPSVLTRGIR
jgi:hypothetical protein